MNNQKNLCVLVKMARDPVLASGLDASGQPDLGYAFPVLEPAARMGLSIARRLAGPSGSVTAMSLGGPEVDEILRQAMYAGADAAVRVHEKRWTHISPLSAALALVSALKRLCPRPDIILCGTRSIDDGAGLVGPAIAFRMDVGWAWGVSDVKTNADDTLLVRRKQARGQRLLLRVTPPAVLCLEPSLFQAEAPSYQETARAAKSTIRVLRSDVPFEAAPEVTERFRRSVLPTSLPASGLAPSKRVWSLIWGGEQSRDAIVRTLPPDEVAKEIAVLLESRGLLD
jgi:electron transfer flavoprotein beta subunit